MRRAARALAAGLGFAPRSNPRLAGMLLAGSLLLVPACAGRASDAVVGSKAFTESVILGEIAAQLARSDGARVEHREGLGGSALCFRALETGAIDAYPEYTGTLTGELLAAEHLDGRPALRAALARRGLRMSAPLGFEDGYAIGMKRARAEALHATRISDLRGHPDLRLGFSNEFLDRNDGWPALRARYGLPTSATGFEHALAYRALDAGTIDATDLYATDAEIRWHDLVVLEDDLGVFPRYEAVFLYRADLPRRAPALVRAIESLAGRIDAATMIGMNVEAKPGEGRSGADESEVASGFLARELGVDTGSARSGLATRVWLRTREHLFLVLISVLAAVVVGVPLGVLAAARPRAGHAILGGVGVIQVIPALALLFLVLPLLGLGNGAAVAALFLYSLLPIVVSTHAGLAAIPGPLRESAEALGLSARTRLLRVDLPLASPSILAGIQTATVLCVGFAMLGAFIGAGGYGQPILAGMRRYDMARIWEGVLPGMAMAFLAHLAFRGLRRLLVPKGLRLAGS